MLALGGGVIALFFDHADDLMWVKYVRLDRRVFSLLLEHVRPIYEARPLRRGHAGTCVNHRSLSTAAALFMTIRFLASGFNYADGMLLAGVSFATLSRTVTAMLLALVVALCHWPQARISVPNAEEARLLSERIAGVDGRMRFFIGFTDGALAYATAPHLTTICRSLWPL
jgi:hypothetical protein